MRMAAIGACLDFVCAAGLASSQRIAPTVQTSDGPVSGTFSADGVMGIYRGIPFAAPPVGELRWKPPQPARPWTAVLHADHFSASCMQPLERSKLPWTREFMTQNEDSEDCLYLNVWTPAKAKNARLPVFVWIYGGGGWEGSAEVPVYGGTELARTGIVVVTFNYRVGVFGYLALPELTAESPHHASGNYAHLDQVAALQWVQKNIQAFGGDPSRVTIAGQSAGAGSVHFLMASPLAKGLFERGIAESGSMVSAPAPLPHSEAEKRGQAFALAVGAATLKQLRELPASALMDENAQKAAHKLRIVASVDGWFLPESPDQIVYEGKQNDAPLITGWTADDFRTRSDPEPVLTAKAFRKQSAGRYGNMADDFLKLYPAGSDEEAARSQLESQRDRDRVEMYVWVLRQERTAKAPFYTYYFTRAMPDREHPEFGAFHSAELPYVFRNLDLLDRPWEPVDRHLSDVISAYWKNLAENGDPNGANLPHWTPASAGNPTTLEIGEHIGEIPVASPEKLQFWIRYLNSTTETRKPILTFLYKYRVMLAVILVVLVCLFIYVLLRNWRAGKR
jgi:para-nitrobenzyl esterase